jgi:hypothetical protein
MTIEMKIGHNGSPHIDESKLDKEESVWFIAFLDAEIQRHKDAILMCDYLMRFFSMAKVLTVSYESSIIGHRIDISATKRTIEYLKCKHGLGE